MNDTLVIIPAFNEAHNIAGVLQNLRQISQISPLDVLVVNDGSTDQTAEVARSHGVNVITLPYNIGYAGALQTGFKYALNKQYSCVIQLDADGQHRPCDIELLLSELQKQNVDIVLGSRFLDNDYAGIGLGKMLVIRLLTFLIKILTGVKITDPSSGLQGLNYRTYSYYACMKNYPLHYPDAQLLMKMVFANYCVKEVLVRMKPRNYGKSMHSGLKPIFYMFVMAVNIFLLLLNNKKKMKG